jgi:hypothetical protein
VSEKLKTTSLFFKKKVFFPKSFLYFFYSQKGNDADETLHSGLVGNPNATALPHVATVPTSDSPNNITGICIA